MDALLSARLRRLRQERHLSLKKVADRLGVHFTTVSSWERGRSEPAYQTLGRLARLYGVAIGTLLAPQGLTRPRQPFRPLSGRAAESVVRTLEELHLATCLAAELEPRGGAEDLAQRTGIAPTRLVALSSGEATFRPTEIAALIRELGSGQDADSVGGGTEGAVAAKLPPSLRERIESYLGDIRDYLTGRRERSHQ